MLSLIGGCKDEASWEDRYQRAHDPWVFRSVLDGKPRMLTIALNDNLWVAYSAQTGALYKAWRGGVNFDGAVYTTVHGPQPSSLGNGWMENTHARPWRAERNGREEVPNIQFRGHRFHRGQVSVNYDLILADGSVVKISERPEYVTNEYGQTGFERVFHVQDLPAGVDLFFRANYQSLPYAGSLKTNGEWKTAQMADLAVGQLAAVGVDGELKLNNEEDTHLTVYFVKYPLLENENKIVGEEEVEDLPLGYRLIARNDCKTCHNTYLKTIGPSYVDVARRYRNTEDNRVMLINKIINGGAGVWGEAAMTPHHESLESDIREMVNYIMSLDEEDEAKLAAMESAGAVDESKAIPAAKDVADDDFLPGARAKVILFEGDPASLDEIDFTAEPTAEGVIPVIEAEGADFGGLDDRFALEITGYLHIPKTNNYVFRLISDDGSRLYIDDQQVINHDGPHGATPMDGEIILAEGYHPFRLLYYELGGGQALALQWRSFSSKDFELVPGTIFVYKREEESQAGGSLFNTRVESIPGDGVSLQGVHPSYRLTQARPDGFSPKVGGMDFLPDGRLVISTWDAEGAVYVIDGVQSGDPAQMSYKKIASGLAEPLGVKVVDGQLFVLQKQELTQLIDEDGDEIIDNYRTLSNDWRVSENFHEFAFGLAYKEPYFFAALAIAILPGGASAPNQIPDRGKAIRIHRETGKLDFVARGLRTPNGIGVGVDGELFIADNQGDWLPSSKILHVSEGAFFGSRAVDSAVVANMPVKLPVVWLPQDEIGNSPSTPLALNDGPYKGQMIHGEVTHGGVKRVFVEKVDGEYQGAVFRFTQGLEAGVNRMVWGPDTALYIGGIGSTGNWSHTNKLWYGLQRLKYNGQPTFEMLAVRAKSDGVEIELTEPLAEDLGGDPAAYNIQQWYYLPTHEYGGPKLEQENLRPRSVNISEDRRRIFLELDGLKPQHVVYLRLPNSWVSANDRELWSTEAWYTLNRIPQNQPGFRRPAAPPPAPNTLSEAERRGGWRLLFDGQSTKGWHIYGGGKAVTGWQIEDGALALNKQAENEGGDLVTDEEFENYELRLDWKISPCGNSGIIYNVVEAEKYDYTFQTGPEMQVLDNTCHPDARIEKHRAGDLYDLIAAYPTTVRPAGQWNQIRLVKRADGTLQHWLNGRKVVETTLYTDEWRQMIAGSKFNEMPDFGKARKGKISLQDHGDKVWFRNIKIKPLGSEVQ